ncbi:MAG: DUF3365 domain-containing protein [Bdellovibrionales bacterium]
MKNLTRNSDAPRALMISMARLYYFIVVIDPRKDVYDMKAQIKNRNKWLLLGSLFAISSSINASEPDKTIIFEKLKSLTLMREGLASTIDGRAAITEETFKTVCKPVGAELKKWSDENGYISNQISHKNRNEKHSVPGNLQAVYNEFLSDRKLETKTVLTTLNNIEGEMHIARIPVASSCLGCHGQKASRPEFIKTKYKNDKAYDFKVGDLRGVYAVFVPQKK